MNFLRHHFPKSSPVRKIWYMLKAITAAWWYRFPAKNLKMVGITGTDGKTTTVEMLSQILQEAEVPHLKISTATIFLNGQEWQNDTKRTTLSPWQMQRLLKRAVKEKAEVAILEVSSHATEQNRVWGIGFDIAGITNITEEHLEDHGGFENYALAKKKLFTEFLKPEGIAILNADDKTVASWKPNLESHQVWVSTHPEQKEADMRAHSLHIQKDQLEFQIESETIVLELLGEFNMENALVAFAVAQSLGIDADKISRALSKYRGIVGRMEKLDLGQNFNIYIDDALTPNAIKKGLRSIRNRTTGKVWAVFGCTGERDRSKRPKVGKIVGDLADFVVLTDDEPYTESAESIRTQIKEGIAETNVWREGDESPHFWEIPERQNAIEFALQRAAPGDTVFIFGMGSYTSRNIGGKEIPWSDKEVVRKIFGIDAVQKEVEQKQVQADLGELRGKVEGEDQES